MIYCVANMYRQALRYFVNSLFCQLNNPITDFMFEPVCVHYG